MSCYVKVADIANSPSGSITIVSGIDRVDICLINVDGEYYALSGVCPHKGGPLYKGTIKGKHLICPWHTAHFKIEDGRHSWPAERPLRTFEVKVEGGSIFIRVQKPARLLS